MTDKKCTKCGEVKPISEFRLRKDTGKYRNSCLACESERHKRYRQNNSEKLKKYFKNRYAENKEDIKKRVKDWRINNPEKHRKNIDNELARRREKTSIKKHKKLLKIKEEIKSGIKKCNKCRETKSLDEFYFRQDSNKYRNQCKKCVDLASTKYAKKNSVNIKKYQSEYSKEYNKKNRKELNRKELQRKRNSIQYRLACNLRSRLNRVVKGKVKVGSFVSDLGCSLDDLMCRLETMFEEGMTWENYGEWHIDHIRPLASFDLTNRKEFLVACSYKNLQPLWAKDNLIKGAKINY